MDPIELTADEADALREILGALAVIGEHGYFNEKRMVEITSETWRDMIVRPAQRLRRISARKRLEPTSSP